MPLPHIIWIVSDQHCGRAMAWNGDPNLQTPVMDRLCREGAGFSRAYANCPVCTPSRGTIFSGRHAHSGPVQGFFDVFKPASPSIATILRGHGYRTAYVGKWHCGIVRDQLHPAVKEDPERFLQRHAGWTRTPEHLRGGFELWDGYECNNSHSAANYYHDHEALPRRLEGYNTDSLTDLAIGHLERHDPRQPLFLTLSPEPPHFPLDAPADWLARYDPAALTLPPWFDDFGERRKHLAIYYAMVANLDWNIGRLLDRLARLPGYEDAIVVYTSDHGDFMGSHREFWVKGHPHEPSVLIPALFRSPSRVKAQGARDGLFSLVDLLPTTLGLAGLPVPGHCQGHDWSAALRGEADPGPQQVLVEMHNNPRHSLESVDHRSLVGRRWKYAFYETGDELLFDLEADPWERDNLAAREPERLAEQRGLLLRELARTREPYFDVLIEHGRRWQGEVVDVGRQPPSLNPVWAQVTRAEGLPRLTL